VSAGRGKGDEPSDFERAVEDVKPVDRGRLRPEPAPKLPARPAEPAAERVVFAIERVGERVEGLAPGADRRLLAKLRRGEPAPDRRIDLHRMDAPSAERALARALARALDAGERCLLVVHGRGLHSEDEPVLKESLPRWLARPPHGPRILAFATAGAGQGGAGATSVLLRRKR
jgi:DNA-nicking Smr family endonuclease